MTREEWAERSEQRIAAARRAFDDATAGMDMLYNLLSEKAKREAYSAGIGHRLNSGLLRLIDNTRSMKKDADAAMAQLTAPPAAPVANRTEGKRRVVCAACKLEDGTFVTGARHMDGIMHAMKGRIGKKWMHDPAAQGFIDQRGVYMTRQEAWKVAEAAGQILYRCGGDTIDGGHLFSENLY